MKEAFIKYKKFILEIKDISENPWMKDETALEIKARELENKGFSRLANEIYQTLKKENSEDNYARP